MPEEGIENPRSIPACAGEPRELLNGKDLDGVDPRVCGGAHSAPSLDRA